jgi:putative zinc finger/helix-turn-helix YgiT family protein
MSPAGKRKEMFVTCPESGEGTLKEGILNIQAQVRGEQVPIQFPGAECPMCGFQEIDSAQMAAYGLATADAYRAKHGLLTSDELRSRRRRLGMSQVEFANHTKASLPSIKRWELGAIQDEAMDELIRLKTDAETARKNLEKVARLLEQPSPVEV